MKRYVKSSDEVNLNSREEYLKENPEYSLEPLFGTLESNDPRYILIFNHLKELGYTPRQTVILNRMITHSAITIDTDSREIPAEVFDVIQDTGLGNLVMWGASKHKGRHSYKIKFAIQDEDYLES